MLASVEANQIVKPGFGLNTHFLGRALSNTNNFFFFKQVCLVIKDAEILHNDGSNRFILSFSAGHVSHQRVSWPKYKYKRPFQGFYM